jgi:hypothetical protein
MDETKNSLGGAPGAVNLEPPKHTDTDNVLVEEIENPMGRNCQSNATDSSYEKHPHVSVAVVRPVSMNEQ